LKFWIEILVMAAILTSACAYPVLADASASDLLKRAISEHEPSRRIELLDRALKHEDLGRKLRSQLSFERGKAYKQMKDCFAAIQDFSSALAYSRNSLAPLLEKAECLILVDRPEEAARDIERYLSIKSGDGKPYVVKGMIYEKQGFLSKAEDEYSRALYYDGHSSKALQARALIRLKTGQPRTALEDANELCRLDPKNAEAFKLRARIHVKLKEYDAALQDYGSVESLVPGAEGIRREKVLVYLHTGRAAKALEALYGDSLDSSDEVECLVLKARAYILLGDYRMADRSLERALERAPENAPAHLYKGVVAMRRKLMDEALDYFNRTLDLDPKLVEAYKERARTFMSLGDNVRAENDLSAAADIDPSDAEIFSMRGITHMNRMLYDAAVKDLSLALDRLPGDPKILFDRAVAHNHRDDHESALSDLNRVIELRPDSARARSYRGVVQFNLGNIEAARKDLEKATTVSPEDPQVWNNLGFFNYKIGKQRGAMDALNRALQLDPRYDNALYNLKLVLKKEDTIVTPTTRTLPIDNESFSSIDDPANLKPGQNPR
jgi:tetratricopeptide (TPR) repeat protein